MKIHHSAFFRALVLFASVNGLFAQPARVPGTMAQDLKVFVETPAVPGYEGQLAAEIRSRLRAYSPRTDRLGDVLVTVGSGAPHWLVAAPMDEPGYVVSRITDDGYLQLQRLPQSGLLPLLNELYSAQPVRIETASGKWIPGVVGGISVHLMPGRSSLPDPDDIANMYVDVGAQTVAEARRNGIPAQYGVTGGGNDGSAFLRYGSDDVALGWPLRYSHSPGEVMDARDLDGLARIVAAICRSW